MIGALGIIGNLIGLGGGIITKYMERKNAEAQGKIDIAKAETEGTIKRLQTGVEGDIKYDQIAAEGMSTSWKDEWLTILISIPVMLCFVPGGSKYALDGFEALAKTPEWFQYSFMGIIVASFGLTRFVMPLLKAKILSGNGANGANGVMASTSQVFEAIQKDREKRADGGA